MKRAKREPKWPLDQDGAQLVENQTVQSGKTTGNGEMQTTNSAIQIKGT
jgi:hypothetical protein